MTFHLSGPTNAAPAYLVDVSCLKGAPLVVLVSNAGSSDVVGGDAIDVVAAAAVVGPPLLDRHLICIVCRPAVEVVEGRDVVQSAVGARDLLQYLGVCVGGRWTQGYESALQDQQDNGRLPPLKRTCAEIPCRCTICPRQQLCR